MDDFGGLFDELAAPPTAFYAQVILATVDHAPLLAVPRLARAVMAVLHECVSDAPGTLWGYVVLPDTVRFIVGPTDEDVIEAFITHIKVHTAYRLLTIIRRADDDLLDKVLRYNPVRGGAIYQVWQAGSHRTMFWTEYKLSNALYDLQHVPVDTGLVDSANEWPYSHIGGEDFA